jgi:hypothetical protein
VNKQKLGKDNWLHILSDVVTKYREEGGNVDVVDDFEIGALSVVLYDVTADDARITAAFRRLIDIDMRCDDCDEYTYNESYLVQDELWQQCANGTSRLCIGCFEKRLGRRLEQGDFQDLPINDLDNPMSVRLWSRLSGNQVDNE